MKNAGLIVLLFVFVWDALGQDIDILRIHYRNLMRWDQRTTPPDTLRAWLDSIPEGDNPGQIGLTANDEMQDLIRLLKLVKDVYVRNDYTSPERNTYGYCERKQIDGASEYTVVYEFALDQIRIPLPGTSVTEADRARQQTFFTIVGNNQDANNVKNKVRNIVSYICAQEIITDSGGESEEPCISTIPTLRRMVEEGAEMREMRDIWRDMDMNRSRYCELSDQSVYGFLRTYLKGHIKYSEATEYLKSRNFTSIEAVNKFQISKDTMRSALDKYNILTESNRQILSFLNP
ncbi:MAG: hypothetical protein ACFCUI_03800, partial [Bernardetiaceae bacterium]